MLKRDEERGVSDGPTLPRVIYNFIIAGILAISLFITYKASGWLIISGRPSKMAVMIASAILCIGFWLNFSSRNIWAGVASICSISIGLGLWITILRGLTPGLMLLGKGAIIHSVCLAMAGIFLRDADDNARWKSIVCMVIAAIASTITLGAINNVHSNYFLWIIILLWQSYQFWNSYKYPETIGNAIDSVVDNLLGLVIFTSFAKILFRI